jgi:hypothetical protein
MANAAQSSTRASRLCVEFQDPNVEPLPLFSHSAARSAPSPVCPDGCKHACAARSRSPISVRHRHIHTYVAPSARRALPRMGPSRRASQITRPSRGPYCRGPCRRGSCRRCPCRCGPCRRCPFAAAALAAATANELRRRTYRYAPRRPFTHDTTVNAIESQGRQVQSTTWRVEAVSVPVPAVRPWPLTYSHLPDIHSSRIHTRCPPMASHIMSKPPSDLAAMAGSAPIQSSSVALRGRTSCENVSNGASSTSPLMVARSTYTLRPDALCATIEPRACRFASHPDPHVRKSRGAHYERVAARERIQTDSGPQTSHALMVP